MKTPIQFTSILFISVLIQSCTAQEKANTEKIENNFNQEFGNYWYQGKAEISSYELHQARYGENRKGEAVLIFVTEDFLIDKQVKRESNSKEANTSVLKLNFIRKFPTGIYDYSMMTSTFQPINQEKTSLPFKSTTSSQEWCGHSWLQLNQQINGYQVKSYSYFESEGDAQLTIQPDLVEDAIWGQIRQNPKLIKEGEHMIFPSTHYLRFAHKVLKSYAANIAKSTYLNKDMPGHNLKVLTINYPQLNRKLEIIYESEFPYKIAGWKESRDSFGKQMQTTATKKSELKSAYWGQNSNSDNYLRDSLKLK